MERQGQRLLLALTSPADDEDGSPDKYNFVAAVAAFGTLMCVIYVILMCTCKNSDNKHEHEDQEHKQGSKKADKKSTAEVTQDGSDGKSKSDLEAVTVNGGTSHTSSTLPGHSRQASSGSAHMRPTSLRELPAPPVSTPNKTLCGVEPPNTSTKGGASGTTGTGSSDYAYHQHVHHSRNSKSATAVSVTSGKEIEKSQSDGYDHLGPKRTTKPTDYDSLADEPESTDGETPMSETGGGLDGHYSLLRERTYAVVVDVKAKAKELFDPYSKVKDKEDTSSDYYSQVKEEDPYNHIGDSGGNVSSSFIRQLRQSRDLRDPYATAQGDSGGDLNSVLESRESARGTLPHTTSTTSSFHLNSPSAPQDDEDVEEEYAVVQKAKGSGEQAAENHGQTYSEDDISPYGVGPPEPPRMYNDYDSADGSFTSATAASYKREHKYSKVTARESLASMSARNALNPYEVVVDIPENTYATVEGGSGDGVVLRGVSTSGTVEKRLSQTSDTYAEIGISGGGLSSSVISSNSSTGGNNNTNSASSSVAPIPPSLDSLHLMTKSQTSSEGDRLSDRHLASPEDSGMSLNLWGESQDDDDDSEDGYSTLKKLESSPQNSSLQTIPNSALITDEDSGEVTLVANYQTVIDCISDNEMDESENDPNYESVDEARAKVALLKARDASSTDSRTLPFTSLVGPSSHLSSIKATNINNAMADSSVEPIRNKDELLMGGQRRRRLDHDYEEVDLSPPSSPVSPPSSRNHTYPSYHITSNPINGASEAVLNVSEERERSVQSHMYEELAVVRAKTLEMNKVKRGSTHAKHSSEDKKKSGSSDKKKIEEKVKTSTEDKRKIVSEDKKKSSNGDKKKSSSEDKKKNSSQDKRKSGSDDKKKGGVLVLNGT